MWLCNIVYIVHVLLRPDVLNKTTPVYDIAAQNGQVNEIVSRYIKRIKRLCLDNIIINTYDFHCTSTMTENGLFLQNNHDGELILCYYSIIHMLFS